MLFSLAIWELRQKFAGTAAGVIWSALFPLTTILIYWLVFSYGLKVHSPVKEVPYTLWFVVGIVPWLAFNEMIVSGVNSITSKGNLVVNVVFPLEILPLTNVLASQMSTIVGMVLVIVISSIYSIKLNLYDLQFFYFFAALLFFTTGLAWLFAAINVYFKDFSQIVAILLNFLFWLTPIIWPTDILSKSMAHFMLYNPIYYIVHGYRLAFVYHSGFWLEMGPTISFWLIATLFFVLGAYLFSRLKSGFSDAI